jgi:uncharacterized protein DUF4150/HNH/endonuclease VII toxin of polymorphic toxin system
MSNEVYANNMEVSCKAAAGKSICSFPDVCFTPPQTPVTPTGVPIPYPNTGMASDCTDGSSTVMISGQEVMLKNKSCFKKSTGDEAGCAPNKGLINGQNTGKVYFKAWSMSVQCEGENVVRHFDLTTHNHASDIGNDSIPWLHVDKMHMALSAACKKEKEKFQEACKDCIKKKSGNELNASATSKAMCKNPKCKEARKCTLTPYAIKCCKTGRKKRQTPHHLLPNSLFQGTRNVNSSNVDGLSGYTMKSAPCCCVDGHSQTEGEHGEIHEDTKTALRGALAGKGFDYEFAKKTVAKAHCKAVKDDSGKPACKAECLEAQLDAYFSSRSTSGDPNDIDVRQVDGATGKVFPCATGPGMRK